MEKGANEKIKAIACSSLIEAKENALAEAKAEEQDKLKKEMAELRKIGVEKFKMKDLFVGATLPDLKSEDLDGKAVKLSDHKGKVVVLDIWATWCPPCRAMIPHERELVERLKGKPFSLISVSFDDEKDTLTKFLEKEKMPWTHWFNGRKGEIGEQLNIRFFPTIFVLDGKGVIRYKGVRGPAMDKAVDALIKEIGDEKKSS
jgi:thiol-disulfide isomerase/thioredoxin